MSQYIESRGHAVEYVKGEALGRYEYVGGGSSKFYHVMETLSGEFEAYFGRIGAVSPQKRKFSTASQAAATIGEKRRKGYRLVPGYSTGWRQIIQERVDRLDTVLPAGADEVEEVPAPRHRF